MSIAEREAENAGPECAFQRVRLDMDDVRDAYIAGRTAEPCKEQVEAVARVLRDTFAWTHVEAPERVKDYHGLAREILDAARKAVM